MVQLINETKREIEDAWNWLELRTTLQLQTVAGSSQYILTGVGNARFKILEVLNNSDDYYLQNMAAHELTKRFLFGQPVQGKPQYYGFNGFSNSDPIVDLYPIPDGVYVINFNLILPQNDLRQDTDIIQVPAHVVVLGAYMKALAERGEDASNGYVVARAAYQDALAANISQQEALMPDETAWQAV